MAKKDGKKELFIRLANPDSNGVSRWVMKTEFIGEFAPLYFDNGFPWGRGSSQIKKEFIVEIDRSHSSGNRIDAIRLNGFNKNDGISQSIRKDIIAEITKQRCVVLGTHTSGDYKTAPDHKDGRKDDPRVMNLETQLLTDFQPLSKPANDAKRQFCKECKASGNRYDAKKLGYLVSVVKGNIKYEKPLGCEGCFWYDPIAFRKNLKPTGN